MSSRKGKSKNIVQHIDRQFYKGIEDPKVIRDLALKAGIEDAGLSYIKRRLNYLRNRNNLLDVTAGPGTVIHIDGGCVDKKCKFVLTLPDRARIIIRLHK